MRVLAVIGLVCVVVLTAHCANRPPSARGLALTQAIAFQTDEPAPSVSQLPHAVIVVVRTINHASRTYTFMAQALLIAQDGTLFAIGATRVTLAAQSGTLVRFDIPNPQDVRVWHVDFAAELPRATVHVDLADYSVTPDMAQVAPGPIRFVAQNRSPQWVHELAVVQVAADGSLESLGTIEALAPGATGSLTLDLPAGHYQLASLLAAGEHGSPVDDYDQGMHTDFTVSP